jgi:hypothetical protein
MNTAVRTRGLAYGKIDSRYTQAIAVQDGTLAMAVDQILSKSRAFAVSSRAASSSVRYTIEMAGPSAIPTLVSQNRF